MGRFDRKVVVVTGAGCIGEGWGNGRTTSVLYGSEGAKLVLVDRDKQSLDQTADYARGEGADVETVVCDVSTPEGVKRYANAAIDRFGGIDVLQANVGIGSVGPLLSQGLSQWNLLYRVNVTSLFLAAQAVIPVMRQRGGGAIVNISSIAALRSVGSPFAAYSSSKAAANQLIRALAVEFAPDSIRCNSVVVGYVDTPTVSVAYRQLDHQAREALEARRRSAVPLQRVGTAWDIARASAFLASDDAQFITGTELVVDGGLTNVVDRSQSG